MFLSTRVLRTRYIMLPLPPSPSYAYPLRVCRATAAAQKSSWHPPPNLRHRTPHSLTHSLTPPHHPPLHSLPHSLTHPLTPSHTHTRLTHCCCIAPTIISSGYKGRATGTPGKRGGFQGNHDDAPPTMSMYVDGRDERVRFGTKQRRERERERSRIEQEEREGCFVSNLCFPFIAVVLQCARASVHIRF